MSKKNQNRAPKKVNDANAVVSLGLNVNGVIAKKNDQSVVVNYVVDGVTCSGVLHVSQFGSTERPKRDQLFAAVQEKQELKGLQVIEVVKPSGDRRFTSVRLSALVPLKANAEEQRKASEAARQARQTERDATIASLKGKIVSAKVKDLGNKPATAEKEAHCYGAFLTFDVGSHRISGLLHVSRMLNGSDDKEERLKDAKATGASIEVVLHRDDRNRIYFSETDVKATRLKEEKVAQDAQKAAEQEFLLKQLRESLADGSAAEKPFNCKVTVNRLPEGQGIEADYCGLLVKVSSEDLAILPQNLKGRNHTVKLVALSEENGVVTAKRFIKVKKAS